jgi:hypothetical protein
LRPPVLRIQAGKASSHDVDGKKSDWTGQPWKNQAETSVFWRNTKPTVCSGQQSSFFQVISVQRSQGLDERQLNLISFKEPNAERQRRDDFPRPNLLAQD